MNEPPGARARVALSGLTVAEYFRDQEGQDVLLFIDNIFRFTQAGSEVRKTKIRGHVINKKKKDKIDTFEKKQFALFMLGPKYAVSWVKITNL